MGDNGAKTNDPFCDLLATPTSKSHNHVPNLSAAGMQLVQDLAQRHGVSTDAATHMLIAVRNGNGSMAQFSHPEFGGSGQWMRGGMTMVSDLFNNQLKYKVDNICSDISRELANHQQSPFSGSFQSQSQNGTHNQSQASGGMGSIGSSSSLFVPDPTTNWWPRELGIPNAIGSQNNVRYAYFAQGRRLAVTTGGEVWVYDTLDHRIGGFAQQQGVGGSITFTSQYGTVNLSTLPVVSKGGVAQPPTARPSTVVPEHACPSPSSSIGDHPTPVSTSGSVPVNDPGAAQSIGNPVTSEEVIGTLERLGELLEKGYLTEDEFSSKKAELLKRL